MSVLVTEAVRPYVQVHLKDSVGAKIHTNTPPKKPQTSNPDGAQGAVNQMCC